MGIVVTKFMKVKKKISWENLIDIPGMRYLWDQSKNKWDDIENEWIDSVSSVVVTAQSPSQIGGFSSFLFAYGFPAYFKSVAAISWASQKTWACKLKFRGDFGTNIAALFGAFTNRTHIHFDINDDNKLKYALGGGAQTYMNFIPDLDVIYRLVNVVGQGFYINGVRVADGVSITGSIFNILSFDNQNGFAFQWTLYWFFGCDRAMTETELIQLNDF